MKGDFTRFTFDPRKHYSGVRMQQGRVLLDSDWNEQADIFDHRSEIEAKDIIGTSGCPADEAGFGIVTKIGDLTAEEQNRLTEEDKERIEALDPGNFLITAGRYYVDGILCENEQAVMYTDQRHEPEPLPVRSSETGEISFPYFPYVLYLDVWKRHVSVMEDPEIRETALGGPDTTTRIETAWQVRSFMPTLEVPFNSCIDVSEHIPALSNGRLTVELTSPVAAKASKCSMAPKGGYQGLENRLYRVEIHDSGRPFGWPRFIGIEENTGVCRFDYPILPDDKRDDGKDGLIVVEEKSPDGLSWKQGQMVEIFVPGTENGTLARVEEVEEAGGEKAQLKLNLDISKLGLPENLRIHRVATFKWSRDNGSVAYSIETIPDQPKKVKVKSLGQDKLLSLRGGDCVEILGDTTEFRCEPGTMAVISENGADEVNRELTLDQDVSRHKDENNPKIRRWDRSSSSSPDDMVSPITLDQAELEDGIAVRFSVGPRDKYEELPSTIFKSGDYWTFAARSKEGKLKELKDAPPDGIEHHYCSLAKIQAINAVTSEGSLNTILDCRKRFPSSKDIFSLYYLGGDGQDGWPGRRLVYPLMVGVAMGKWRVANAHVDFIVISGDGTIERIEPPNTVDEEEKAGVYCAIWTLGGSYPQVAKAVLLDTQNNPVGIPIYFSANLNLAEFVEYIPPEACNKMSGILDVQSAINSLCPANILYYVGGAGQDGLPGQMLPIKLQVGVADSRGPVSDVPVKFIASGGGKTEPNGVTKTKGGIAECYWTLGPDGKQLQQVEAYLVDFAGEPIVGSLPVRFSANFNRLAELRHVSSENQEVVLDLAKPGQTIQVKVQAVNDCGPVMGASVLFYAPIGRADPINGGMTDKYGIASCNWSLSPDANNLFQILTATLDESEDYPIHRQKNTVTFKVKLNVSRNILYALSGNGQVGVPGQILILKVCVADSRGPVSSVPVGFAVANGGGATTVTNKTTNSDGIIECQWTLGKAGDQQVEAFLAKSNGERINDALSLYFNASLIAASQVAYAPQQGCTSLSGIGTVQNAIDALCDRGIRVSRIFAVDDADNKLYLDNNATLYAGQLTKNGLTISFDDDVDPNAFSGTISKLPVRVIIDLPYPLRGEEVSAWNSTEIIGYRQIILDGSAEVTGKRIITWKPSAATARYLINQLFYSTAVLNRRIIRTPAWLEVPVLARLVLKGNFIWSATNPKRYLKPGEDGKRGADFEMCFWLESWHKCYASALSITLQLASAKIKGGSSTVLTVTMNNAAPVGGVIITLQSSSESVAKVESDTLTILAGSISGTININSLTQEKESSVRITAISLIGNAVNTVDLTITK